MLVHAGMPAPVPTRAQRRPALAPASAPPVVSDQAAMRKVLSRTPLLRIGEPLEIGNVRWVQGAARAAGASWGHARCV